MSKDNQGAPIPTSAYAAPRPMTLRHAVAGEQRTLFGDQGQRQIETHLSANNAPDRQGLRTSLRAAIEEVLALIDDDDIWDDDGVFQ